MKVWAPLLALVAVATAQQNAFNIPPGGLQVTAGTPITLTWSDPSSGTVTIKLQQGSAVTPDSGITLVTGVAASDKTVTVVVPADEVNASQYNFEIIDDSDPSNYNFTPGFDIAGATCVGTCDGAAASSAAATASSTASGSSASTSAAASSSSVSASSASASSSSATASTASGTPTSSTSSSATASVSTSAPSQSNVAESVRAQAGLVVAFVAAIAAF